LHTGQIISIIYSFSQTFIDYIDLATQRLAAQRLGRVRFVVTILAGKRKSQLNVLTLSLGQVG
jgi:hypothetical protein